MARRFPAEWEAQAAIIVAWPFKDGDFGEDLTALENTYQLIAQTILEQQQLIIICQNRQHRQHIQSLLPGFKHFVETRYNDIWLRDTGPISIFNDNNLLLLNFEFNGWGRKYPYHADNSINQALFQSSYLQNIAHQNIDMVLEGGSIESDGLGTLLTTRQCLLNPNRNPGLSQQQIEHKLRQTLGVERILWLDQTNLLGDDTDAHIDTLARFCGPELIVYSHSDNPDNPNYSALKDIQKQLNAFSTAANKPYQITALPLPKPIFNQHGLPLPANYANFLIINHAVLVPTYNDPQDKIALQRLSHCFADRKIIPIPCHPLIQQYGSLHCMTMQIPALRQPI